MDLNSTSEPDVTPATRVPAKTGQGEGRRCGRDRDAVRREEKLECDRATERRREHDTARVLMTTVAVRAPLVPEFALAIASATKSRIRLNIELDGQRPIVG